MKNKSILNQITLFTIFIAAILVANNVLKSYLINNGIEDYNIHLGFKTLSNCILGFGSFLIAKELDLFHLGGLTKTRPKKLWLIIFPLIFLVLLNGLFLDTIPNVSILNLIILAVYCLSIGFSEELSLRSVLLPLISKYFGNNRKAQIKAVFISALIFGLLHLIKFDKGLYGEISQVFFATFIGVMFGAILMVIKRVYPLIIIHAIIDFVAKLDTVGQPIKETTSNAIDVESAILTILLTLPCLIYGIYVIKKQLPLNN
ncbi:MAG: CPBP family intramembrane glutamic endopeptidase [Polaribacter sp.]|uniref:CPBP family intramembrane glutamic endopeptidase n=1 Tax=Polaribacter sp. TaxID=1920175 RepID=UPI002F353E48